MRRVALIATAAVAAALIPVPGVFVAVLLLWRKRALR